MSLESLQERVGAHDKELGKHEARFEKVECRVGALETSDGANKTKIDTLCDQLKDLVVTLRWCIGIVMASALGFALWMLQQMLVK